MKISSILSLVMMLFFSFAAAGEVQGGGTESYRQLAVAHSVAGVVSPVLQRRTTAITPAANSGQVTVTVNGADDITDILLAGGKVTFKTIRGQQPDRVTSSFTAPIPARADLFLALEKLEGRGNVSLSGRPSAANNYTVSLRIIDSPRGKATYRLRLDWELPAMVVASPPATRAPTATTTTRTTRTPAGTRTTTTRTTPTPETTTTTTTRVTRSPETVAGRTVPARVRSSRIENDGHVEIKMDGIDDIVEVQVRGNQVNYRTVRGRTPGQVTAEFSSPMPVNAAIDLGITKSYGRGDIILIEKPVAGNNYTATVRLNDSRGGSDNYKFRLDWNTPGISRSRVPSSRPVPGASGGYYPIEDGNVLVTVEGADDVLDLHFRGDKVETEAIKGGTPRNVTTQFSTPLPLVKITDLKIEHIYGRGDVVIMAWPEQSNDYTTTVRILDPRSSQDNYRFRIIWKVTAGGTDSNTAYTPGYNSYDSDYDTWIEAGNYQRIPAYTGSTFKYTREGGFHFQAVVDETALIRIAGGQLWGQVLKGKPMRVLDARFSEGYPNGDMEILEITGFRGRGEIEILEKPWSGNDYSIVIRIHDSRGGDAEYEFDLRWKQK